MRGTQFAELSAFVAVAEHRNFTKAAAQLGVSPSTLSQTVRSFEERLGVRLLNRTTRSVALTEAGERLLLNAQPVLDGIDKAIEAVNSFRLNQPLIQAETVFESCAGIARYCAQVTRFMSITNCA
jgi:DNA-binding transcriptional LysR family regulator